MTTSLARADAASTAPTPVFASSIAVALPFLFPFTGGPSVNAWQQLATWTCMALLLAIGPSGWPARRLLGWLALLGMAMLSGSSSASMSLLHAEVAVAAMGCVACVGAGWARSPMGRPSSLAWGLLGAGLLSAMLGLLQYFGLATTFPPWANASEIGQAYGNLRQRNQFATLISIALIAALWLHGEIPRRMHFALRASGVALVLALAASTSRTGLLQLLLISAIAAFLAWRERRVPSGPGPNGFRLPAPRLLLALIPIYVAAAALLPLMAGAGVEGMGQRLREGAPLVHSRLVLWSNVLDLVAQRPWTGWGWGELAFAHYNTRYDGLRFTEILDNAHSVPLHLAVELGLPAALLVCGGFGWMVLAARPWHETHPARLMAWAVLGAILLHSLLEYPLWYGPFQMVFGLCLGFLWPSSSTRTAAVQEGRPVPTPCLPAAAVLMAVAAYGAWDYTRVSQLFLARQDRLPTLRDDTLAKVRHSWLFANQVRFAELALTTADSANAAEVHAQAQRVLHFSPEPRVIVKLIESATLLGLYEETHDQARRFRIAFPAEYARWLAAEPVDGPSD